MFLLRLKINLYVYFLLTKTVIVLINKNNEEVNVNLKEANGTLETLNAFITSSAKDLEVETVNSEVKIPSKSIVTITTN